MVDLDPYDEASYESYEASSEGSSELHSLAPLSMAASLEVVAEERNEYARVAAVEEDSSKVSAPKVPPQLPPPPRAKRAAVPASLDNIAGPRGARTTTTVVAAAGHTGQSTEKVGLCCPSPLRRSRETLAAEGVATPGGVRFKLPSGVAAAAAESALRAVTTPLPGTPFANRHHRDGPSSSDSPMVSQRLQQQSGLKQRRESLSPEEKRRLMCNEEHVIGAALSLHFIHDVSLDQLDERLEFCGVVEDLKNKAIATIRAKLAKKGRSETMPIQLCFDEDDIARLTVGAPLRRRSRDEVVIAPAQMTLATPAVSDADATAVAKYKKMLKCGVPIEGAVAAAMRDGLDERLVGIVRGDDPAKVAATAAPGAVEKAAAALAGKGTDDDAVSKYKKMLQRGVPKQAVKGLMTREGKTPAEVSLVCGAEEVDASKKQGNKAAGVTRRVKTLHWEKLEGDVSQTVWAIPAGAVETVGGGPAESARKKKRQSSSRSRVSIGGRPLLDGPLVGDDDLALLEEVFATAPPPKKAQTRKKKKKPGRRNNSEKDSEGSDDDDDDDEYESSLKKVTIINDSRRAANVGIGLSYFARKFRDDDARLCRAIIGMDDWFNAERLRSLTQLLPTKEETQLIEKYAVELKQSTGKELNDETLARPERFFRATGRWPQLVSAIDSALLRSELEETVWEARSSMRSVSRACDAIRESTSLALVLRTLLKLGNHMNDGVGHLSDAVGVTLGSLSRIAQAKGRDDTSLIDYLANLLQKKRQEKHLDFVDALPSLEEAQRNVDEEKSAGAILRLRSQLAGMKKLLPTMQKKLHACDADASASERASMADNEPSAKQRKKAASKSVFASSKTSTNKQQLTVVDYQPSMDRAALNRFVIEAERTIAKAMSSATALEKQLVKFNVSKKELLAYFGEAEKSDLKAVFSTLAIFVSQVRGARDKLKRKHERDERQRKAVDQRASMRRNSANELSEHKLNKAFDGSNMEETSMLRRDSAPVNSGVADFAKKELKPVAKQPKEPPKLLSSRPLAALQPSKLTNKSAASLSLSKCRNSLKTKKKKQQELALIANGGTAAGDDDENEASGGVAGGDKANPWAFSASTFFG